ncbi:hypothetical protein ABPG75_013144 [Micractinium tetrahymenae]
MSGAGAGPRNSVLQNHDLIVRVFQLLDQPLQQMQRTLPLVCQAWHAAAHSRELLSSIQPEFGQDLADWEEEPDLADQLESSLRACGAGGTLRELQLEVDSLLGFGGADQLSTLTGLQHLRLSAHIRDHETTNTSLSVATLYRLTALEQLWLSGSPLETFEGLPPSLTQLHLAGWHDFTSSIGRALPAELEVLTRLHTMGLVDVHSAAPGAYGVLLKLPALRRLSLTECEHVPSCLSGLTTLETLAIDHTPSHDHGEAADELGAALACLGSSLTHLALRRLAFLLAGLPAGIASMTALRRLCWLRGRGWMALQPMVRQLPPGPYLAGLRELGLDADVAAASLAALDFTAQLTALAVGGMNGNGQRMLQVAAWAGARPGLQDLALSAPPDGYEAAGFRDH